MGLTRHGGNPLQPRTALEVGAADPEFLDDFAGPPSVGDSSRQLGYLGVDREFIIGLVCRRNSNVDDAVGPGWNLDHGDEGL